MKLLTLLRSATDALGLTKPPEGRVTLFDVRQQPTGLVQTANVERIHAIMEAADAGDARDLFALYQEIVLTDSHLQAEFAKRKLALLGDAPAVLPVDKNKPEDVAAAEAVREMIAGCKGWLAAMKHLLDSVLWPVAVVEKVWVPSGAGFRLAELVPVPDQLLDFTDGKLRIRLTDERGTPNGQFAEAEESRYVVHRGHLLTFPDHRGGPLRSLVWWWLLTTMDREWWTRFLDRYGSPFLVGKYDQADDSSRSVLERAFSYATRIGGLVVSRETEVEIQQAAAGTAGDAFEKFLAVGQREKSKLIVGQSLSSEGQSQGIGAGASTLHGQVRQDIRQWDAAQLGDCLRQQVFAPWMTFNRVKGGVPRIVWGGEDSAAQQATGTLLGSLAQAGLEVTDDGISTLSERVGFPLQRKQMPGPTLMGARAHLLAAPGLVAADGAGDDIARQGAAELARAFRGAFAPVRRLIVESTSADDLEKRLRLLYADWPAERLAGVIEPALVAFAANGAVR